LSDDELLNLLKDPSVLASLLESLGDADREHLLQVAGDYQTAVTRERGADEFLEFVKAMWSGVYFR